MHKTRVLMAVAMLAMLPLAGCIENMDDLKERLQGSSTEPDPIVNDTLPTDEDLGNVTGNQTQPELKPPVARITIFGPNGALVYRAGFVAENQSAPVLTDGGEISLVAADSEVVNPGAELVKFEWTVGEATHEGRAVKVDLSEPQIAHIVLRVTDSKGAWDEQMVMLGIKPVPFDEVFEFTGGPLAGTDALPTGAASHTFNVYAEKDGKMFKAQSLVATVDGGSSSDEILTLTNPAGEATSRDGNDATGGETLTVSAPAAGDWTATVGLWAGATPEYTLKVTITYVQIVEGLDDGHGHAH